VVFAKNEEKKRLQILKIEDVDHKMDAELSKN
jgi:hypothetical protein